MVDSYYELLVLLQALLTAGQKRDFASGICFRAIRSQLPALSWHCRSQIKIF